MKFSLINIQKQSGPLVSPALGSRITWALSPPPSLPPVLPRPPISNRIDVAVVPSSHRQHRLSPIGAT